VEWEALLRGRVWAGKHMGKRPRWVVHSKEAGPWAGRAIVISLDACEGRCTGTARGCAARPMGMPGSDGCRSIHALCRQSVRAPRSASDPGSADAWADGAAVSGLGQSLASPGPGENGEGTRTTNIVQ